MLFSYEKTEFVIFIFLIGSVCRGEALTDPIKLSEFASPSMRWRPVPLWFGIIQK